MRKWTERALNGGTGLVLVCAILLAGLRVNDLLQGDTVKPRRVENYASYSASGHVMGPVDAPVVIVEFADYQCPYCKRADSVLTALRSRYPSEITVVYRHYPLSIHDFAMAAAQAADCSAEQEKFEDFHHTLFLNASQIGKMSWIAFAEMVNMPDIKQFEDCLLRRDLTSITRDRQAADSLGIDATPTFLINEQLIAGFLDVPAFDAHVRAALNRVRK